MARHLLTAWKNSHRNGNVIANNKRERRDKLAQIINEAAMLSRTELTVNSLHQVMSSRRSESEVR